MTRRFQERSVRGTGTTGAWTFSTTWRAEMKAAPASPRRPRSATSETAPTLNGSLSECPKAPGASKCAAIQGLVPQVRKCRILSRSTKFDREGTQILFDCHSLENLAQ